MAASSHRSAVTAEAVGRSISNSAGPLCSLAPRTCRHGRPVFSCGRHMRRERPSGPGLDRWHEGAFLAVLGWCFSFGLSATGRSPLKRRNFDAPRLGIPRAGIDLPVSFRCDQALSLVKSAILIVRRPLPVFLYEAAISERVGMSQRAKFGIAHDGRREPALRREPRQGRTR